MKTLEQIVSDMNEYLHGLQEEYVEEEIKCNFEDYEVDRETEIIISSKNEMNSFNLNCNKHSCYINTRSSNIIEFETIEKDGLYTIVNARIV